ncbi:B3 domain-containing transcription factor VRN1-like [Mercurialis annua]|uniref:B3 domain-containing transcription factor VRN1-like n=1 Tax=Mercurialis annua TaxID=3986 RepID=UPI00215EFDE0|nr:B3 domain-containing transcription factor VRN1-like [Mercurialis annua]
MVIKPTSPHFFKIVLHDKKLEIPKKFVRIYGTDLPNLSLLKLPNGDQWKIELLKSNGEIWLGKGWQEFMEFYSLAFGSFLVFQYDQKNCWFNVIIFDTSASEIEYPCKDNDGETVEPYCLGERFVEMGHEEVDNNSPVQISNNVSSLSRKRKESLRLSATNSVKKVKLRNNTTAQLDAEKSNGDIENVNGVMAKTQRLTIAEKDNVLRRARDSFKSRNPHFMTTIQPSYLCSRLIVAIPSYVNEHFKKSHGDVILYVVDGRTWSVKYSKISIKGSNTAKLYLCWKTFVQDNGLKVGDVCVFEIISCKETTLRVFIYRNMKDTNSDPSLGNKKDSKHVGRAICKQLIGGTNIEASNDLTSPNPSFKGIINLTHMKRGLMHIPREFMDKYAKKSRDNVALQVKDRQWNVKLIRHPYRGLLSAGWSTFSQENSLQARDVCIFELVNAETMLFEVSISRSKDAC